MKRSRWQKQLAKSPNRWCGFRLSLYLCLTQKEAVLYAQGLIHTCEKPVILYNNPRRTGFDLSAESLLTLIADPRVIG